MATKNEGARGAKAKSATAGFAKHVKLEAEVPTPEASENQASEETPQLPSPRMVAAEDANNFAKATAEAASTINERIAQMNQTAQMNETAQMINDRSQAMFGDMNERAKQSMERSTRIVEEMTDLTRGNVEALVASSRVAARGLETLTQEAAEFGRRSFEEASAAVRSFAEVRSATDLFRLQSDFARSAFDNMVAESSKMSEAMIKLAGDVAEPITSRYSVAAERVKNMAA